MRITEDRVQAEGVVTEPVVPMVVTAVQRTTTGCRRRRKQSDQQGQKSRMETTTIVRMPPKTKQVCRKLRRTRLLQMVQESFHVRIAEQQ